MIIDYQSLNGRYYRPAGASLIITNAFVAFGATTPAAPKQGQGIYFLRTVGKLMNN